MKLLYVIHDFLPSHQAGAEIYTYLLAREMAKIHEVAIFFTEIAPLSHSYSIKRRTVDTLQCVEVFRPPAAALAEDSYNDSKMEEIFSQLLTDFKPDIIHLQHLLYHSLRYPEIARRHGIPTLFTLHDYWLTCPRWGQRLRANLELCYQVDFQKCAICLDDHPAGPGRLTLSSVSKWFRRKLSGPPATPAPSEALKARNDQVLLTIDHTDLFIAPSPFLQRLFIEFGIPRDRIILSDNGVEVPVPAKKEPRVATHLRFGFIGTISEHKGLHVLIEAFNTIPREKAELHIYGDLTWFPEYSTRLRRMATSPVISFHGPVAHHNVAATLDSIDILVVPSIWFENSPLTIHEAFLAGVPVIASDIGGMADLVKDHVNGLLFAVGDPQSLADALRKAIDSETLLDRLREGIPHIKSIQENCVEMQQIYHRLLN